jgi:hypothetical protein
VHCHCVHTTASTATHAPSPAQGRPLRNSCHDLAPDDAAGSATAADDADAAPARFNPTSSGPAARVAVSARAARVSLVVREGRPGSRTRLHSQREASPGDTPFIAPRVWC